MIIDHFQFPICLVKGNSLIFVGIALGLKREVHIGNRYVGRRTVALTDCLGGKEAWRPTHFS